MKFKVRNASVPRSAPPVPSPVQPRRMAPDRLQALKTAMVAMPTRLYTPVIMPETRLDTVWATQPRFTRDRGWVRIGEHD